jgi:DNA-binding transcriptional ArsR family regulator
MGQSCDGTGADERTTLELLADETALAVLAALDEPRTASETADVCDLGLSTVYRKLERLTDADLCEERVTVRSDGCRVSRYRRSVDELRVSLLDGAIAVDAVRRERSPGPATGLAGAVSD